MKRDPVDLSCPFCGRHMVSSSTETFNNSKEAGTYTFQECSNCGARGPTVEVKDVDCFGVGEPTGKELRKTVTKWRERHTKPELMTASGEWSAKAYEVIMWALDNHEWEPDCGGYQATRVKLQQVAQLWPSTELTQPEEEIMAVEIERKFLVKNDDWKNDKWGIRYVIRQAYIFNDRDVSARIRFDSRKARPELTFKVRVSDLERTEITLQIDGDEANELMAICGQRVDKTRMVFEHGGLEWELDVFEGDNKGLLIAEVELQSANQAIMTCPSWVGAEVTRDPRYLNANLAQHPYKDWSKVQKLNNPVPSQSTVMEGRDPGDEDDNERMKASQWI